MLNKQKIIKLLIFSIVVFTLLVSLIYLGHVEYCREYVAHNNEITSAFNKNKSQDTKIEDYREACSKLKPDSLIPVNSILSSLSGLMFLISIAIMITVKIYSVAFKRKIFSKKEKFILLSAILLSFITIIHISLIELDFYYFSWNCSRFLL